jgi:homoserine kinase type II
MIGSERFETLLAAWPLPGPRTVRPIDAGTNNRSYRVETPGGAYFLRIYQNIDDPRPVRYEHAVLLKLQTTSLTFVVPRPLPTRAGNSYVVAGDLVAALFPFIAGDHADRRNLRHVAACGAALGELDVMLAGVAVDPALSPPTTYGALAHVHPLVPDPLAAIASLPILLSRRQRMSQVVEEVMAFAAGPASMLPRQLIHGDFGSSNALIEGDRVNAVLDFEFSGPGLRAMDFAVGLWAFGRWAWETDDPWSPSVAFASGYRRWVALSPPEIGALPSFLRLREVTSLLHRIGRLRRGLTTEIDVADRAEYLLWLDAWLKVHGDELVQRVSNAGHVHHG